MSGTKPTNEPRRRLLNLAILAALGGSALAPAPASAADLYWACGSAAWDSTCWSATAGGTPTLGQPQDGDSAFLTQSGAANLTVDYSNTAVLHRLGRLAIDATGTGTMTLSQTKDILAVGYETIGSTGTGTLDQTGGTHTVGGWLTLGENSGSSGTYNLSSGSLSASDGGRETIGSSGTGTFTQSGGTNTTSWLDLGENSGGNGTYSLSAGSLTVGWQGETIGYQGGAGTFNQSGGTHVIYGTYGLTLGSGGIYNLSAGNLTASGNGMLYDENIWGGTFNQTGGTNTTGTLDVNGTYNQSGGANVNNHYYISAGSYSLSGTGSLSSSLGMIGLYSTGTFTQSGGTHTVGNINIGYGGNGTYNLSAGSLTVTGVGGMWGWQGAENIGLGGSSGTFNQSGGTHTISGTMVLVDSADIYNFTGGTLTAGAIVNNGAFRQSGATTVTASITNNGAYNASGPGTNTVAGDFTNNASGTIKTTDTTLTFTGAFTNHGAYISDPSDNYFTDLIVGATGYLVGGTGDNFFIGNNFTNNSTNALWNTAHARLVFDTGADSLHDFTLGGLAASEAFSWGTIELAAGNTLNLFGMSFYVDTLVLGSGAGFNLDGATIYYRHLVNNGGSIAYSNGGQMLAWGGGSPIAAVPEPETYAMLLAGLGLLGFNARRRKNCSA